MRSRVWVQYRGDRVLPGTRQDHDAEFWAIWKPLTYQNWSRVQTRSTPETEKRIWKYMLVRTNLLGTVEKPSRKLYQGIMQFRPSGIPHALAQDLIQKARIPYGDEIKIEEQIRNILQCSSPNGVLIPDLHPVVEKALLALSMKERFKIPYSASLQEMDYRTVIGFRLVAEQISDHFEHERVKEDLTRQAQAKRGF